MPTGNGDVRRRKPSRVEIHLPFAALSTNKMYSGRKRRSVYYKQFRKNLLRYLSKELDRNVNLKGNLALRLEVGFSSPLSDLSNSIKSIEDVLTEHLRFDDRQIVSIEMHKFLVNKGDEYMKVSLYKTRKNIDRRNNGKTLRK